MEELEEIVFLSDFHYSKENWDQILELDNRFHEMVYEACASKELTRVLRDYHHYLQRIRRITLEEKARAHASINEHRAIAEALKARMPGQRRSVPDSISAIRYPTWIKSVGKI